ncbi:hypothetical protein H0H93_015764 [Arthromyces matolae]|nr:hypothetical protein H0H93_015764 [Arthromyces matolae]
MSPILSERPQTPDDFDELFNRVWTGYTPQSRSDALDDYNRTNSTSLSPEPIQILGRINFHRQHQLPLVHGLEDLYLQLPEVLLDKMVPAELRTADRRPSGSLRPISFSDEIRTPSPTPTTTSRHEASTREMAPWHQPQSTEQEQPTQQEVDLDDSSSLYPGDNTPFLPLYERVPTEFTPPSYYDPPSSAREEPGPSSRSDMAPRPILVSEDDHYSERSATPQRRNEYPVPYVRETYQSTSDLSYVDSPHHPDIPEHPDEHANGAVADSPYYGHFDSPLTSGPFSIRPYLSATSEPLSPSSDQYLGLDGPNTPGPSNVARRPTQYLQDIRFGRLGVLELHGDMEDEIWEEEEEPDRYVNFALLSHLAVQLRDKVPRGDHVKGGIPYPRAFTGKDIVTTIHAQISRELVENHGGTANDRRAALVVARSLQSQLMFVEVEWGGRILQDGVEDVFMFLDDEENGAKEALPSSVVTILAKCYSPSCGEGPECYAYGCPRKSDSLTRMLPSIMETPLATVRESWPKTVPPEVLHALPESEINRQIIIHKLISKEEQYVKDLDLVDSVFIQPLRKANPPVITPLDRLEEFIETVFHNILDVRECNRRLLDFLYVRQREEAPVIKKIGDIILGIAADFREPYPAYIGNHSLAERRMKEELESNPDFRLFIEQCWRQQAIRPGASGNLRLDLRHFLNRPSEHLQKYPVLLQAICKTTAKGSPDADFLVEATAVIKNLQGVAQLRMFQSAMGRGVTGKWGWHDLVAPDVRPRFSPDEAERQSLIFEFVKGEMIYVKDLENIGSLYIRPLRNSASPIIPDERIERFMKDVFHNYAEVREHHRLLLNSLHQIQRDEHPKIKSITAAILSALLDFREAYLDYIPNYPIAAYRIDEEAERNPVFREFLENCVRQPDAHRTTMKDFLNCPLPRLLQYVELLRAILELTPRGHEDLKTIPDLIEMIESLARETEPGVASSKQKGRAWILIF